MSILTLDVKYEKEICKKVLGISRFLYAVEASPDLPTASEVMKTKENATPEEIREQIQENMDFIMVSMKYCVFDIESLRREMKELKKGDNNAAV